MQNIPPSKYVLMHDSDNQMASDSLTSFMILLLLSKDGRLHSSDDSIFFERTGLNWKQLTVLDFLPISSNTKPNLPEPQSWLGHCLRRLTAIQPNPFQFDVVVRDSLFFISNHSLQKWIVSLRFADGNWSMGCFDINSCGIHTSSFFEMDLFLLDLI